MGETTKSEDLSGLHARSNFTWGQVKGVVGRIWLYVLGGVGIGAVLQGYVPLSFFIEYAAPDNSLGVLIATLAGIYVSEALLEKGVPSGIVLALMMSIATISLPVMIILRKLIKLFGRPVRRVSDCCGRLFHQTAGCMTAAFIGRV